MEDRYQAPDKEGLTFWFDDCIRILDELSWLRETLGIALLMAILIARMPSPL